MAPIAKEKPANGKQVLCSTTISNKGTRLDVGKKVINPQSIPKQIIFDETVKQTHKYKPNIANPKKLEILVQSEIKGKSMSMLKLKGKKNFQKYSKGITKV